METRKIGDSDLEASVLSLGTMTFGGETSATDAEAQMDFALEKGINLIDTAEIYPTPLNANTFGQSESIIGTWISKRKNRSSMFLSTKAAGPGGFISWVREGRSSHNKKNLYYAVEGSLRRLKTDYIDLFHLHWPDRAVDTNVSLFKPPKQELEYSFWNTMEALEELTKSGKIRFIGLSNESPWGIMKLLKHQELFPSAKIVSVQSPYNLLNRNFESSLAEIVTNEDLGLIAYSPLAGGLLTDTPSYSLVDQQRRKKRNLAFLKYCSVTKRKMNEAFRELANSEGARLSDIALNFILSRPFTKSAIVGNTTLDQLKENLSIIQHSISQNLEKKINKIYKEYYA